MSDVRCPRRVRVRYLPLYLLPWVGPVRLPLKSQPDHRQQTIRSSYGETKRNTQIDTQSDQSQRGPRERNGRNRPLTETDRLTGHRHRPRRQRRRPRSPLRAPWEIVLLCHLHDLKACYLCNRTCTWAVLQVNKYIFDIANLQQYLASWSWLRGRGFVVDVL